MVVGDWAAVVAGLVIIGLGSYAWATWPGDAPLPMQWNLAGKPTWFAPRPAAFALLPAISLVVLATTAYAAHHAVRPPAPAWQLALPAILVAIDLLHLHVARRYA